MLIYSVAKEFDMSSQEESDLKDRIFLIQSMIAEGRRTTESWGWTFVLWGVAYYVAIAWAQWGNPAVAWPVTMVTAGLVTGIIASRMKHDRPDTTLGRAVGSVWIAFGASVFLLMVSLSASRLLESRSAIAIVCAMLGMAHATSGLILKWRMQLANALVWWITAVVACFESVNLASIAFLVAIFLCQIVFGIYAMVHESRRRRFQGGNQGAIHA